MQAWLRFLIRRTAGALCEAVRQLIRQSIRPADHRPLGNAAGDHVGSRLDLIAEDALLRQQWIVPQLRVRRPAALTGNLGLSGQPPAQTQCASVHSRYRRDPAQVALFPMPVTEPGELQLTTSASPRPRTCTSTWRKSWILTPDEE